MSGTKEKATGKQSAKDNAGAVSPQEVAQVNATDLPGAELPGSVPGNDAALDSSSAGVTTEQPLMPGTDDVEVPGNDAALDSSSAGVTSEQPLMPGTDDVEVLEVRAVATQGFWRCGRFWPHDATRIFVSDDPDGDNEAYAVDDVIAEHFISQEKALRLKAEPNLRVSVLQKVREAE
ncbi:TPA: hypothetical protein QDZ66_003471 [Pluralibacter gergoviae]|nr:hypothetical protein [Pluralibacter gergoviae]